MTLMIGTEADLIREARLRAGQGADGPAPQARLGLAVLTLDAARRLVAFAFGTHSTGWSALSRDAAGLPLLNPVMPQDILAMVGAALGLDEELPMMKLSYRGPAAGLWALAGLIDAHRQQGLEALLARRQPPPFAVSADDVELRLIDASTMADPRWLGSLLDMLAGPALARSEEVAQGLAALRDAGLADKDRAGFWQPTDSMAGAFAALEAPLAGIGLSLATRAAGNATPGGGGDAPRLLVLIRSLTGLVLVQPELAGSEMELRSVRSSDMLALLGHELTRACALMPASGDGPPATRFCAACGMKAAPGDRFCASCGAPLG
jgi:hypothetical protein